MVNIPIPIKSHLQDQEQECEKNSLFENTTLTQVHSRFATTMSTGALAVVLSNTPNKFPGLTIIGEIFFILQLLLFVIFTVFMTLRAFWFPQRFLASLHHPVEGLFFGSYWVSVSLILNATQAYGVPKCGPWLPVALRVCFWTYVQNIQSPSPNFKKIDKLTFFPDTAPSS